MALLGRCGYSGRARDRDSTFPSFGLDSFSDFSLKKE